MGLSLGVMCQAGEARRPLPLMFVWLSACLVAVCFLSLLFGAGGIGPGASLSSLLGMREGAAQHVEEAAFVIHELRLPRTMLGLVVGMALGVAGALLQAVARNPLADIGPGIHQPDICRKFPCLCIRRRKI